MSVLSHLQDTSSKLVLSDTENANIGTSITTLETRLVNYFGTEIKEKFQFGSNTRNTILPRKVDEASDVDYMVVFDNSGNYKPQTFLNKLKMFVETKYSTSEIYQSSPTIVLQLNHIKFELAPAYRNWGILYIPAPRTAVPDWISTDPTGFNSTLIEKNKSNNFLIKPTVRLLKYWNVLNDKVYSSFGLEQKIVSNSYFFCTNLKDYFYSAVESLQTFGLSDTKKQKVEKAKQIVANTKKYEADNMPFTAGEEIKKLIPSI